MKFEEIAPDTLHIGFGERCGCDYNDIIFVPLSPAIVENLWRKYEANALCESTDYIRQGKHRKICDYFAGIYREWERRRETINMETKKAKEG